MSRAGDLDGLAGSRADDTRHDRAENRCPSVQCPFSLRRVRLISSVTRLSVIDLEKTTMLNKIALLGVGAVLALAPLSAFAQTDQSTAPAAAGASAAPAAAPTGTHSSQMRHSNNMSKQRARSSAAHMHHMHKPATPPKSP
jgi:hypothetical protein